MTKISSRLPFAELLTEAQNREAAMVSRLRELVEIESPSSDKDAVDRASHLFAAWARLAGGRVRRHRHREHGDSLEIRFGKQAAGLRPTLLLGHLDTVWEHGTLVRMPWFANGARIAGPGVLDMKAGTLMALTAIEILRSLGLTYGHIILLLHGDEEIGSPASRKLTESIAAGCDRVFVLEPAEGDKGAYKTARKAVGMYRLSVTGVASHSGVDFKAGHSAILEISRQIQRISSFTRFERGITVNPGLISGGTRSNVVAAEAWVEVDVRVSKSRDIAGLKRQFRALVPHDKACRFVLEGGINRPPMERRRGTAALFRRASELAGQLGFALEEAATGGGSDGNFTAALGVPTLDGMGAVGAGAHALHEHLQRKHLVPRIALLAAMLANR